MLISRQTVHRAFSGFVFLCLMILSASAHADVTQADNGEVEKLLNQGVPLVDVRTRGEWKTTGVIEGSHLITFFNKQGQYDVEQWLAKLDSIASKDQPFMLICQVGGRTRSITDFLFQKRNYTKVINVTKGIQHWIDDNRRTVPIED